MDRFDYRWISRGYDIIDYDKIGRGSLATVDYVSEAIMVVDALNKAYPKKAKVIKQPPQAPGASLDLSTVKPAPMPDTVPGEVLPVV